MKAIIVQKTKKVQSIFEQHGEVPFNEFFGLFTHKYPKDWKNVLNAFYNQNTKRKMNGLKPSPMPPPNTYMENLYKVGLERYRKSMK